MRAMIFACVLAVTGAAFAVPAGAQEPGELGAPAFGAIDHPAGAYALDPTHASVIWRVRHQGLALYVGRFETLNAALQLDPQAPENSSLSVTIPAAGVDTGHRNAAGERSFDRTIANRIFGAENHPEITFVSTGIERTGDSTGRVTGHLTFNGVTQPVTLDVTFNGGRFILLTGKHTLGFSARTVISRSAFGADAWSQAVGDEVEVLIEAEFQRQ